MQAAQKAISSPLLEDSSVNGARGVIINVTGGPDLSLMEVNEASCVIQEAAHEDANIIFGAVVDPDLTGKVKITVIATGFDRKAQRGVPAAATSQTPVDLTPLRTTHAQRVAQPAASGGAGGRWSAAEAVAAPLSRRPAIEVPLRMADPARHGTTRAAGSAAGREEPTGRRRSTSRRSCGGRARASLLAGAGLQALAYGRCERLRQSR